MRYSRILPDGFTVVVPDGIKDYIEGYESEYPNLGRFWEDVVETLRFVAHRIGSSLNAGDAEYGGRRVYRAESDAKLKLPSLVVAYEVTGTSVLVRQVMLNT